MLGVILALASAVSFGSSDFVAGLAARRANVIRVTLMAEGASVVSVVAILPLLHVSAPSVEALAWGGAGGLGGAAGTLALYAGFRRSAFSITAPLSAVSTAIFSVVAALLLGQRPTALSLLGIVLTLPAIILVTVSTGTNAAKSSKSKGVWPGTLYGLASGVCFAVLFVGFNRAGTASGLWPVVAGQVVALLGVCCLAAITGDLHAPPPTSRRLAAVTGISGAAAMILYFFATHYGTLAIAAVLASLYPAVTIVLARLVAGERMSTLRVTGLSLAVVSVALITFGGAI